MALVARHHHSGLVLANEAQDETTVSRALKRLDDRLVLQKHRRDDAPGGYVYKVLRVWSDSHPAAVVLTWMDIFGRPLPLSSGLVDEVQRHMLGARNSGLGTDVEHNQRLTEKRARDRDDLLAAIGAEHKARVGAGRVGVSMATTRKLPYWQRTRRAGAS